jgi:hypothetical protein
MRLAALQAAMQARMLVQSTTVDGEIADTRSPEEATERLAIYANAYTERLTGALASMFPHVQRSMGAEQFAVLTSQFSREQPSRYRSVRDFGDAFPAYLALRFRGVQARGLQELAHWEWSMADAFDASDDDEGPVDLSIVPAAQWASLRFGFTSSLRCVDFTTNALDWRRATDARRPLRWRRLRYPLHYALWRADLEVYFRALDPHEAAALDSAKHGETFGEVCERLLNMTSGAHADFDEAARRAAALLQTWVRDRWIVRVYQP